MSRIAYRARWVFPIESPPLEHATIEIEDGRIVALHNKHDPSAIDLGNVALIPGLVNAHTHLELSDIESPLTPASPFTAWLRAVMTHRRARPTNPTASNERIVAGLAECAGGATTLVGDIVGADWCEPVASSHSMRGVVFLELIGLRPERVAGETFAAQRFLTRNEAKPRHDLTCERSQTTSTGSTTPCFIRALSPHAPYSVHPNLFQEAVLLAVEKRAPLAIHLAETTAELQLLRDGTGEFRTFLEELGVWNPTVFANRRRPLDFLELLARLDCALVIHGNYLAEDELQFLARHPNISVVYCPRTHAFFGHAPHPWREMLSRGINVALGTDSRASNPDLSLWNELLFLRTRFPEMPGALLLQMGTWNGARALGYDKQAGILGVGKMADLAVVPLPDATAADPYTLLFHAAGKPSAVMSRE